MFKPIFILLVTGICCAGILFFFWFVSPFRSTKTIVLDDFNKIQNGMTEKDVESILGQPGIEDPERVGRFGETCKEWQREALIIRVWFNNQGKVAAKEYWFPTSDSPHWYQGN